MKHVRSIAVALGLLLGATPAWADFLFTVGAGTTSVGFDSGHSGTSRCAAANSVCFAFVPMDTTGAAFGVTGNPFFVTFPSTPTVNLGTIGGASTAANQTTLLTDVGPPGGTACLNGTSSCNLNQLLQGILSAAQLGTQVTGSGGTLNASGINLSALASSTEPTAISTGKPSQIYTDLAGKLINSPYANRENYVSGSGAGTTTGAITMLAAQGSGVKIYGTDIAITRGDAGTTAITAMLNDSASTVIDIPNTGGGGGYAHSYLAPLVWAANTAATCTASTGVTTLHCSISGFKGY